MSSQIVNQNPTSRIIYGCMGLGGGWDNSPITAQHIQQAHQVIDTAIESGITIFDHADIYTRGKAEKVFGIALKDRPELANQLTIQSKCGIRFADETGPGRYDFSKTHILNMVDGILERLGLEQIDTLLLHRPDPLMVPEEVAQAIETLQQSGKIRQLGVSNMNLHQMTLLQSALSTPIVCNQLEMSLTKLDWLEEGITSHSSSTLGTIEYCRSHNVELQAWGSLSQGLFTGRDVSSQPEMVQNTAAIVAKLAAKYQVSTEAIVLGWLLRHPANIAPVIGTTNLDRIRACAQAESFELSREDWYLLFEAARGQQMP
ncbi:oxidoreductase aldo/keto reductase family [Vibrio maritimus]|uniref:Oxidoreductase aldo/keto reductase family n=1 Tax=Vibrio maritimus TaxID=990268 RepID=A0A090T9M2_9VIBR|nr:oxidoreductase aldo/keto reductase family [Vibrio maritimus]